MARYIKSISLAAAVVLAFLCIHSWAQQNPKRLIMKDGSYQTATQWEVKGDRVRYYSAERYDWEELPKELVDWAATDKYNNEREGTRDETIKEIGKADEADERESPLVAPGLRLPSTGGVYLFDNFKNQPQLVELVQNGSELNKHTGRNILRSAINPVTLSSTQTIELKGEHARVQAHTGQPAIFLNIDTGDESQPAFTQRTSDRDQQPNRYGIVRVEQKKDVRVVGKLNVAMYGKVSQKEVWIPVTTSPLGEWVKLTPAEPLEPGEYAVVELLEKKQINFFVWDFGVDPAAPANPSAWTPKQPDKSNTGTNESPVLETRPK
ncbi:MAG TPA: hypothetical protein VKH81_10120 [Candidatus Angelobacter sp.]|nr:hypothetical protein [Candidatus Angelobacter sp.]